MNQEDVLGSLQRYVREEVLRGNAVELQPKSPLLEWGVLNSMEIIRLLKHIQDYYGVVVPPREVTGENLKNLDSIARLITRLHEKTNPA